MGHSVHAFKEEKSRMGKYVPIMQLQIFIENIIFMIVFEKLIIN